MVLETDLLAILCTLSRHAIIVLVDLLSNGTLFTTSSLPVALPNLWPGRDSTVSVD